MVLSLPSAASPHPQRASFPLTQGISETKPMPVTRDACDLTSLAGQLGFLGTLSATCDEASQELCLYGPENTRARIPREIALAPGAPVTLVVAGRQTSYLVQGGRLLSMGANM